MHFSGIVLDSRQILSFSKKFGEIPTKFRQNLASKRQNSIEKCRKLNNSLFIFEKSLTIFDWNFEVWAVQKYANLVDRVKSFPTSIYLQKSASIQPRTSLSKFGGKFNSLFIRLLSRYARWRRQFAKLVQDLQNPRKKRTAGGRSHFGGPRAASSIGCGRAQLAAQHTCGY